MMIFVTFLENTEEDRKRQNKKWIDNPIKWQTNTFKKLIKTQKQVTRHHHQHKTNRINTNKTQTSN